MSSFRWLRHPHLPLLLIGTGAVWVKGTPGDRAALFGLIAASSLGAAELFEALRAWISGGNPREAGGHLMLAFGGALWGYTFVHENAIASIAGSILIAVSLTIQMHWWLRTRRG